MKKDFETNKKEAMDLYYKMLERESKARFINGIWTGVILSMLAIFLANTAFSAELSDYHLLVKNCVRECSICSHEEKVAVTQVVLNRAEDKRFPNSIHEVIFQPKQFSWTGQLTFSDPIKYKTVKQCQLAVDVAIKGPSRHNFTHYYLESGAGSIPAPKWSEAFIEEKSYGFHRFGRI